MNIPEGEEVLDLLLARRRGNVLDVDSVGGHDVDCLVVCG